MSARLNEIRRQYLISLGRTLARFGAGHARVAWDEGRNPYHFIGACAVHSAGHAMVDWFGGRCSEDGGGGGGIPVPTKDEKAPPEKAPPEKASVVFN